MNSSQQVLSQTNGTARSMPYETSASALIGAQLGCFRNLVTPILIESLLTITATAEKLHTSNVSKKHIPFST